MNPQNSKLRTIFLGTPRFAETVLEILAESPFRPVLVITEPDRPVGRKQTLTPPPVKILATKLGIPVAQPTNHAELAQTLRGAHPDLGLVAAYGRILKPEALAILPHGFLNVHASLLPQYRGASPIQAAILANEIETGVTIMQIDEGLDTGPVVSWAPLPIKSDDTTPTLSEKLAELGGTLLVETIAGYLDGTIMLQKQNSIKNQVSGIKTDHDIVTKRITKENGQLTGHETPDHILRMLRAYTPWPGVWADLDGQRVILHQAHIQNDQLIPDKVQLAGKNPVNWPTFQRDRTALAAAFLGFINR